MRRMVRPLRDPVPSCAAPLAVVSVMSAPPSGPVAGLAAARGCAGGLGSGGACRRARHGDGGFRRGRGSRLIAGVPRVIAFGTQRGYLLLEVSQRLEPPVDRE